MPGLQPPMRRTSLHTSNQIEEFERREKQCRRENLCKVGRI